MKTVFNKIILLLLLAIGNAAFLCAANHATNHTLFGDGLLVEDVPTDEALVAQIHATPDDDDELTDAVTIPAPTPITTTHAVFVPIQADSLLARTRDLNRRIQSSTDDEEEFDEQAALIAALQYLEDNADLIAATDETGATMLLHAVRRNYPIVAQAIASRSPDLIDLHDTNGTSPRQAARDLRRTGMLAWFNEHHPAV